MTAPAKSCDNCAYGKKGVVWWYCKRYKTFKSSVPCVDWVMRKL